MATESATSREPGAVGYVGLLIIVAVLVFISREVYTTYLRQRPAVISLSAYFVGDALSTVTPHDANGRHLKVRGKVYQDSQPVGDGNVRVTVSRQDRTFSQSVSVSLKDGEFETEDPAFGSLQPYEQIWITAEVSSHLSDKAIHEIYLNTTPPALTPTGEKAVWAAFIMLVLFFFFAFTGKKTPAKNRIAIIFSYLIIGIFLAVPLLAPVLLLHAFPNLRRSMVDKPVGLVITRIPKDQGEVQWAVNIGGYSKQIPIETSAKNPENGSAPINTAGATAQDKQSALSPTVPPPSPESKENSSTRGPLGAKGPDVSRSLPNSDGLNKFENSQQIADVEGGLVIPLYVIILAVIGGAINMTRKVPRFQREGEYSELNLPPPVGRLETSVISIVSAMKSSTPKGEGGSSAALQESGQEQNKRQKLTSPETAAPVTVAKSDATQPAPNQEIKREPTTVSTENQQSQTTTGAGTATSLADQPATAERKPEDKVAGGKDDFATKPPANDVAKDIDGQLEQLVKQQIQRNCDADETLAKILALVQQMRDTFDAKSADDRILGFESFEDWLGARVSLRGLLGSNWRVELLNQYMYLISAPFLAIVAYYILLLLGFTKPSILVVVSFSVGLISERILSWILSVATGYLRSDAGAQPAGSQNPAS